MSREKACFKTLESGKSVFSAAKIILAFLLVFTAISSAEPVSKAKADKMVRGWLSGDSQPFGVSIGRQIQKIDSFTDSSGEILYYVVYLEPDGFLIVAGDDDVEPIICFVQTGTFDPSDSNPLGALVSSDLPARISSAKDLRTKTLSIPDANLQSRAIEAKAKWERLAAADTILSDTETLGLPGITDIRVEPFVVSRWGQANIGGYSNYPACYNYYTGPYGDGDNRNYPCGCVTTATVQLMRYHQYPAGWNWGNMPLVPDLSTTEVQRQTVGGLCYDVAVEIDTTFGPGGSEAFIGDASAKLKTAYSYSNSIISDSPSMGTTFSNMVNTNLDGRKPVLLALRNSGTAGGHAVMSDGYGYNGSTLYHHLNMGWDGTDDAWYNLPTVEAYYDYDVIDYCVYNVFTSGTGEIISGRVKDMAGNPIPDVTVSAKATGTITYYATTNAKGIYAFVNLPSDKTYTVTAAKSPYVFLNQSASAGKSTDNQSSSGNKWAVDFTSQNESPPIAYGQNVETLSGTIEPITLQAADDGLPNPPGDIRFIITELPVHGRLTDPSAGIIRDVPYELAGGGNTVQYQSCSYYAGGDGFEFVANDYGTAPSGGDSVPAIVDINVSNVIETTFAPSDLYHAEWPLLTGSNQGRTQVIYLSSDIGGAKRLTDLAVDIDVAPGQVLNNWTIRMKHTSRSKYSSSPYFETSGWTTVYQGNEQPTPIGWRYFHFQNAFNYNGSSNLMIDFSFNNSSSSSDGYCVASDTGNLRVVMSFGSTGIDPINWTDGTVPGLWGSSGVPNIKLIGEIPAVPIAGDFEPDCDVDVDDLEVFAAAWLSETGDPAFDVKCDIYKPADGIIDFRDLATLAYKWLTDAF
jgi:hypothetical protein